MKDEKIKNLEEKTNRAELLVNVGGQLDFPQICVGLRIDEKMVYNGKHSFGFPWEHRRNVFYQKIGTKLATIMDEQDMTKFTIEKGVRYRFSTGEKIQCPVQYDGDYAQGIARQMEKLGKIYCGWK